MIIDCRSAEYQANCEANRRRVFVDGVEISHVWYLDTEVGFVRTYRVAEDIGPICGFNLSPELRERGEREGWDMPFEGVVSKTIRGVVELKPFSESRLAAIREVELDIRDAMVASRDSLKAIDTKLTSENPPDTAANRS